MTSKPSCRLFVHFAREAHRAVILRRGPSKQVQLILWHTDTDEFFPGQWLKGRIYEHRCDISADGGYFIYFAAKHKGPFDSWTAISKPPYLTALVLWPKGDCWDGGGLFESPSSVWVNHPADESHIAVGGLPKHWNRRFNEHGCMGEDRPIETIRLKRDGWGCRRKLRFEKVMAKREGPNNQELIAQLESYENPSELIQEHIRLLKSLSGLGDLPDSYVSGYKTIEREILAKHGSAGLTIEAHHGVSRFNAESEYFICPNGGSSLRIPGAVWVDLDQRGRIVFARDGSIWEAAISTRNEVEEKLIREFNSHAFERLVSPAAAQQW